MDIKDAARFYQLEEAMNTMRIDSKMQHDIWCFVSAVFNLRNIGSVSAASFEKISVGVQKKSTNGKFMMKTHTSAVTAEIIEGIYMTYLLTKA